MSNASTPVPMSFIGLFVCILLMLIFIPHLGRIAGKLAFVMGISRGREGMASASSSTTAFIAPDGSTAVFSDGNIIVTPVDETKTESIYHAVHGERNVFTNNNGGKVVVTRASGSDGGKAVSIAVTDGNGNAAVIYAAQGENGNTASASNSTNNNNSASNYDHYDHYNKSSSPVLFYGPDGGTAKMGTASDGQRTVVVTSHAGQTTVYYLDTSNPDATVYKSSSGATITVVAANGTTTLSIRTVQGEVYVYTDTNSYSYDDFPDEGGGGGGDVTAYSGNNVSAVSGPAGNTAITTNTGGGSSGIPRSAIPPGDEDLYMLKSEALVPICPKCEPVVIEKSTCQPCPAPARCPEPQFECTKTYTAKSLNSTIAPVPVMSDFSSFGR